MKSNTKRILKILLLLAMVSFIFPFFTVSCSSQSLDVSGVEAMVAVSFRGGWDELEDCYPNIFLIIAFALNIACLILVCKSHGRKHLDIASCICAAGASFALIAFKLAFWTYYGVAEYRGVVGLEFRWGYYLAILADTGAFGCAFLNLFGESASSGHESLMRRDEVSGHGDWQSGEGIPRMLPYAADSGGSVKEQDAPYSVGETPVEEEPNVAFQVTVRITGLHGEQRMRITEFPCVVGSDRFCCGILAEGSGVDEQHAILFIQDGEVYIEDLGTTAGTWLNGDRISTPEELLSGDEVYIGESRMVFEVSGL